MLPSVGILIRERRLQLRLSVRQVCDEACISAEELAELEWRACADIDCHKLSRLANAVGLELSELIELAESDVGKKKKVKSSRPIDRVKPKSAGKQLPS